MVKYITGLEREIKTFRCEGVFSLGELDCEDPYPCGYPLSRV